MICIPVEMRDNWKVFCCETLEWEFGLGKKGIGQDIFECISTVLNFQSGEYILGYITCDDMKNEHFIYSKGCV